MGPAVGRCAWKAAPIRTFAAHSVWHDLDIILEEAKARGMQVWILDDKHYPSGMANGALLQAPEELCRQNIFCNRLTLGQEAGPVALSLRQAGLLEGPGPTQEDIRQGFLPGEPARRFDPAGDRVLHGAGGEGRGSFGPLPFSRGRSCAGTSPPGPGSSRCGCQPEHGLPPGLHQHAGKGERPPAAGGCVRAPLAALFQEFGKTLAGFFSDEPNLGNGPTYTKGNTLGCGQDLPWSRELESALEESWGPGWRRSCPGCSPRMAARKRPGSTRPTWIW